MDDFDVVGFVRGKRVAPVARAFREWARVEPEDRLGCFFLAGVEDARLLQAMQDLVARCVEEAVSETEFKRRAYELLGGLKDPTGRPYHDPLRGEGMSDAGRRVYYQDVRRLDSAPRLRLIYRTQRELAQGYRRFLRDFSPFFLDFFPGWRFVRTPGAKVKRRDHVEHEGEVRLKTDVEYWLARNRPEIGGFGNPFGPWGFNSWMRTEPVSREECEALGLLAPGERVEVPPLLRRWGLAETVRQATSASLAGLRPEWVQEVTRRVQEAGGRVVTDERGVSHAEPVREVVPEPSEPLDAGALQVDLNRQVDLILSLLRERRERG